MFDFDTIEKRVRRGEKDFERVNVWRISNPDKVKEIHNKWVKNNRSKVNKIQCRYFKKRRKIDHRFSLDQNFSSNVCHSLKGLKSGRSWESLVGYTIEDLVEHLESQFWKDENINWDNYGSYWHVDHIRPKTSFNYKIAEDPEFKECWKLSNLQPLEAIANMKKSDKFEG